MLSLQNLCICRDTIYRVRLTYHAILRCFQPLHPSKQYDSWLESTTLFCVFSNLSAQAQTLLNQGVIQRFCISKLRFQFSR